MTQTLLVGTRKGLFQIVKNGDGWQVTPTVTFLGDPVTMILHDPRDGTLYAALALGHFGVKLHRSNDLGKSWAEIAAPQFPQPVAEADKATVHSIWALEPGSAGQPGLLWAGTIGGGLFRSWNKGDDWELIESLWRQPERGQWMGGGNDAPGIHSVLIDPRDPNRLTVGVSCGGVWKSDDGAVTWRQTAHGMYADYMPEARRNDPHVQDPHRLVACRDFPDQIWAQHHNGVFRSDNAGETWQEVTAIFPSKFGFAVAVHPHDPATAWFVPAIKDECRVPVDGKFVVTRTKDSGRSFEVLTKGLPEQPAYDLVFRHGLAVNDDGTMLAMGSTTGHLWLSDDSGESWQLVAGNLPPIYVVRFAAAA